MWRRKSSFLPLSKLKNTKTEEQKENLTKDLSEGEWKRLEKILMGQEFEVELISTRRAGIQRVYREGEEHLGVQESRFVAGENVVSSREVVDAEVKKLLPEAQKNFDEHLMSRCFNAFNVGITGQPIETRGAHHTWQKRKANEISEEHDTTISRLQRGAPSQRVCCWRCLFLNSGTE